MLAACMLKKPCNINRITRYCSHEIQKSLNEIPPKHEKEQIINRLRENTLTRTELIKTSKKLITGKPIEEKILFNTYLDRNTERLGFKKLRIREQENIVKERQRLLDSETTSVAAKWLYEPENKEVEEIHVTEHVEPSELHFPFRSFTPLNGIGDTTRRRIENKSNLETEKNTDYPEEWLTNYGTADLNSPISDIPCSGCGAHLHCKDLGLPGFIPSETFKVLTRRELYRRICQRCYFLREHNMALKVSVSPEDYVRVISEIDRKVALVLLVVDVLDFPSSVWPGILDIIGRKRPVVLVGNKVDLVPLDGRGCLERMKTALSESAALAGLDNANLKHVALVSAKTGFGVEELITKLWNSWKNKGDIYILGCTNVGKSSLFNALLQSDLCKSDASDLIDRATTSVWPGTTLNLLKFPVASPSGIKLYERTQRLISLREINRQEFQLQKEQLKNTQNPIYASLMGKIDRTFLSTRETNALAKGSTDPFSVSSNTIPTDDDRRPIYNEEDLANQRPKFCYDTPGTVHEDQILTLLTMKELELVVPRELVRPKSFLLRPGMTLLLGGLGRIDYVEGDDRIILTVFSSDHLPVTIIKTEDVDAFFEEMKGSPLIAVPSGGEERLKEWPAMEYKEFDLTGIWWEESLADITLSTAGWVAVTLGRQNTARLSVGTPEARGIHLRKPPLLPKAVEMKGGKIRASPAYRPHKLYYGV